MLFCSLLVSVYFLTCFFIFISYQFFALSISGSKGKGSRPGGQRGIIRANKAIAIERDGKPARVARKKKDDVDENGKASRRQSKKINLKNEENNNDNDNDGGGDEDEDDGVEEEKEEEETPQRKKVKEF